MSRQVVIFGSALCFYPSYDAILITFLYCFIGVFILWAYKKSKHKW